jgi:hypothetical protein
LIVLGGKGVALCVVQCHGRILHAVASHPVREASGCEATEHSKSADVER